jgi:hypothetical protein
LESDSNDIEAKRSLVLLEAQAQALPKLLLEALQPALSEADLSVSLGNAHGSWLVTGVGASEGPARLCVAALRASNISARFLSTSYFVGTTPPKADGLIVVSQHLSPNGRIALAHASAYQKAILVTSASSEQPGVQSVRHGPREEPPLFLRVQGPALAAATCLRGAAAIVRARFGSEPDWWTDRMHIAHEVTRVLEAPLTATHEHLALIGLGTDLELLASAQSKLVEGLLASQPPIWDALAFVHGPYQSTCTRPITLLACSSSDSSVGAEIWRRLRQLPPHELIECASTLRGPLAYFAYDAFALALVLSRLRKTPKNLLHWPGKQDDTPLYELAAPLGEPKGARRA